MNRSKAFDDMFNVYLKEGRELGINECRELYPEEFKALRRCSSTTGAAFRRLRIVFKDRWHEIRKDNIIPEEPDNIVVSTEEPDNIVVNTGSSIQDPLEQLRSYGGYE